MLALKVILCRTQGKLSKVIVKPKNKSSQRKSLPTVSKESFMTYFTARHSLAHTCNHRDFGIIPLRIIFISKILQAYQKDTGEERAKKTSQLTSF
jgi:hypothetical protein